MSGDDTAKVTPARLRRDAIVLLGSLPNGQVRASLVCGRRR